MKLTAVRPPPVASYLLLTNAYRLNSRASSPPILVLFQFEKEKASHKNTGITKRLQSIKVS